jgi:uncharacterized phage infection (PIP) family protein YhgE
MPEGAIAVTGSSRGIGAAIAVALAARGFTVACLSRGGGLPEKAPAGVKLIHAKCDVTDDGAGMLGALGLIAGLWAEKFDQMAAFQNFVIMPMTFLSGVFYSVKSLPDFWQGISHLNPFFYMIDGFRRGFFGISDVSPWLSLLIVGTSFLIVAAVALRLLARGYKLRD